jgi:rRNA maturation RNase YbeY
MIHFHTDSVPMPDLVQTRRAVLENWIKEVAAFYGFALGDINYIFCDDEAILRTNRQFLSHDYYTDIITFDYSTSSRLAGDIFISLDTVRSNADERGIAFGNELCRILIHGVLHLTGQGDKTPDTRAEMTRKEDHALSLLPLNADAAV